MTARARSVSGAAFRSALAALCATLATSCWQPSFDEDLSLAYETMRRMTRVATIDVTGVYRQDLGEGFFLPRREASPADGLWISTRGPTADPERYASPYYMSSGPASLFTGVTTSTFQPSPSSPVMAAMSPSGSMDALSFCGRSSSPGYAFLQAASDTAGPVVVSSPSYAFAASGTMVGAGFVAASSASDLACAIYYDGSVGSYWTASGSYGGGSSPAAPGLMQIPAWPADLVPAYAGFAVSSGGYWYLSVTESDGTTRCLRWPATLISYEELPGIDLPLVAALASGWLLGSDGETTKVYDADGTELYAFATGPLRFVHERWDAGLAAWISVFSMDLFLPEGDKDSGTLRAVVYEMPSEDLGLLAGD